MKHWRTVLVPTDIRDPQTSAPLYVYARIRPMWFWYLRRVKLFALIVWRKCEDDDWRLDWRTAWKVSECAIGLTE